jgi:hypothetical protein
MAHPSIPPPNPDPQSHLAAKHSTSPRPALGAASSVGPTGTSRPRDGPPPVPGSSAEGETKQLIARATEQLRQERATFEQARRNEARWFSLRLIMGYASILLLAAIMVVASYVLFNAADFPASVVMAAGAALFVDVLGLLIAVWKIALNPHFYARLEPVTRVQTSDHLEPPDRESHEKK